MNDLIVFFSPMCVLDNASGAAISVRNFLETAARAGIRCASFTASAFDSNAEVPLKNILGPNAVKEESFGKRIIISRNGVEHNVFLTRSTLGPNISKQELARFEAQWRRWLRQNQPKVVLTFGSSRFTLRLQNAAREMGARIVFYLANADYDSAEFVYPGDVHLCPSNFLKDHYARTLGVEARVLRTIMNKERLDEGAESSLGDLLEKRRLGFVTFMNPIPHKGLTLFAAIARLAQHKRPRLRFLVTEGRMPKEILRRWNLDLSEFPNVWWLPNQQDVKAIYERTNILLVPSFWQEGFSRAIIEAQLSGIPVIASPRGGSPEALNGGGFLLNVPPRCTENYRAHPDRATVERWWEQIVELLDNDSTYIDAVQRALSAAEPFHPDKTSKKAVQFFRDMLH